MQIVDTHSHLFTEEFSDDLSEVIERARQAGVSRIYMPNIDASTIESLMCVCRAYEGYCFPMLGLHPTSVGEGFQAELDLLKPLLDKPEHPFVAIGEVGLDLYWDKTFRREQEEALRQQIAWALEYDLPLVIHCREAFDELYNVMCDYRHTSLRGIFHSFTGTTEDTCRLLSFEGFMLGINGVLTFKKSTLPGVLTNVPLERLVLETDSPYLAPVPYRGKRNESAYIQYTLAHLASVYGLSVEEVATITTNNAKKVFEKG
ncbi:MAG: TatD family hydrolase [Bacteroidaceae bacterium]|nr:TatD family hydrolase [Bacteroidaceae bacterium]